MEFHLPLSSEEPIDGLTCPVTTLRLYAKLHAHVCTTCTTYVFLEKVLWLSSDSKWDQTPKMINIVLSSQIVNFLCYPRSVLKRFSPTAPIRFEKLLGPQRDLFMWVVAIGMFHIRNGNGKFKNIYILSNNKPICICIALPFCKLSLMSSLIKDRFSGVLHSPRCDSTSCAASGSL